MENLTPTTHVALVGQVCVDHNSSEQATYQSWGSGCLYMAKQAAFDGLRPDVVASYGPDLLDFGIDFTTLNPVQPNLRSSLVFENITKDGKRTQLCHNYTENHVPPLNGEVAAVLGRADIVVVPTITPSFTANFVSDVMQRTALGVLKVVCPQGYFREISDDGHIAPRQFLEANDILKLFDLAFLSEDDMASRDETHRLAAVWAGDNPNLTVVVTEAERGATYFKGGDAVHVPTTPLTAEQIIDSVGAGDTFAMSTGLEYFRSNDITKAILAGHKAAAAKLGRPNGQW